MLNAVAEARRHRGGGLLHLIYAPETSDPLALVDDDRRITQRLHGAVDVLAAADRSGGPRIVTLDCDRVAPYLLEHDAGLDDPLFEASVTHAHAELGTDLRAKLRARNENRELADRTVCGWIVSPEGAFEIAARLNLHFRAAAPAAAMAAGASAPRRSRQPIYWYHPDHLATLWPALREEQRAQLLGPGVWLMHPRPGELAVFSSAASEFPSPYGKHASLVTFTEAQWRTLQFMEPVLQLVSQWHALLDAQGARLPADARQRVLGHLQAARGQGLDGDNLAIYTMVALQLVPGATDSATFREMLRAVTDSDISLREGLRRLPEDFWARHALPLPDAPPAPAPAVRPSPAKPVRPIKTTQLFTTLEPGTSH